MQSIIAAQGTQIRLTFTHVDDDLVVFWNGDKVYEKTDVSHGPKLSEDISIVILPGRNVLVMVGGNDGGPAHFAGRIEIQGKDALPFDARPGGMGIVWSTSFVIQGN